MKFEEVKPVLFLGGAVTALVFINKIVRNLKGQEAQPAPPDISDIPKGTGNVVCKQSYSKEEARVLFPKLATQVYYAKGVLKDDYPAVIDAFNRLRTKGDLYIFQGVFSGMFKSDLLTYCTTFLDASEMAPILNKIKKLKCNL